MTHSHPLVQPVGPLLWQIPFATSQAAQVTGGEPVVPRAADESDPAVTFFHEARAAERGDCFVVIPRGP